MSAFSPRQMFLLDQACAPLREAFPDYGPYLVGTTMEPRDGRPPRDVDVRIIMSDEAYDKMRAGIGDEAIWFLGLAIGQYLASLTGMPIDCQFQRATEANKFHADKPRNPLGTRSLRNYRGDCPVEVAE